MSGLRTSRTISMFLSLKRICVMLSLQRREHGRQKRISTAPVSPSSVASRDEAESYSPKSSPRANLVQQMAPTVQTPRKRGTEKRVAPAAACPEHVSRLDRAADPPHATALGQTESRGGGAPPPRGAALEQEKRGGAGPRPAPPQPPPVGPGKPAPCVGPGAPRSARL